MKADLDLLMAKHNLDGILVTGSGQHNPAMVYLTGGAPITAEYIKKRDSEPVLFSIPIEREEAARTGLQTRSLGNYNLKNLLEETQGDLTKAVALRYQCMFLDIGLTTGRIGIYGQVDAGASYAVFSILQELMPEIKLVGELDGVMLSEARLTKDSQEIERIRKMGQITTQVMAQVADFLVSHRVENEVLIQPDGSPLTIAAVKKKINLWLAEKGVENPLGTIFAIGRDAGIPHSTGNPDDWLRLGKPIMFDIFPCEPGGGYFFDCTRTWSLGYATDELCALYEDVLGAYNLVRLNFKVGEHCTKYQELACSYFKQQGHQTIDSNPNLESGYTHVLGHGIGLDIHERPWFGFTASKEDRLTPGIVFTVEPGLYYPEKEMGVRLEDTVWVTPEGEITTLVEYSIDLILPMIR